MRRATLALLSGLSLVASLPLGCTPADGCVTDEDCEAGEQCRPLQERDENVCVRPVTVTDAGPDEEGDPVAISTFTATPNPVASGGTVTLAWQSANATSCLINGVGSVDDTGSVTVTPEDNTRYTLSCQGEDGPATESVDVDVIVEVTSLTLDPDEENVGADITAAWTTVGASACALTAGTYTYAVPADAISAGDVTFPAEQSGDVTLSCDGAMGPGTDSVTLQVARVVTFTATPAVVESGGASTLAWTTENMTGCAVDDVTDANTGDQQVVVNPTTTTAYTLRCQGFAGVEIQATAEVTVGTPTDAGPSDAGSTDAGATDAGADDAGTGDAG